MIIFFNRFIILLINKIFIKFEMEYIHITGFTCSTVGSDRYENTEYLFVNINL